MARRKPTRSPGADGPDGREGFGLPEAAELERLKLSAEVAWYLVSRGIPLPDCPPHFKTPEAGEVLPEARFDVERVDKVLRAFGVLRHTKGKWAGQPLKPDPWQVAYIIAPVFGWVRYDEDAGRWVRVVRALYGDVPRKNGKSTLLGGIAIYMTAADGEAGAEVVAAATTKDQARFVFSPVKVMVEKAPGLKGHVKAYTDKIVHPASGSYFQVISSVADAQHGANLHAAVIDELHVHKSPDMVETIETGTGSRDEPLLAIITTADDGRPESIYARWRNRIEQLARRVIKDATTYGVVWCATEDDDPFSEETLRKANPGYGVSPTRSYLKSAATKAKESPADLSAYLRLHLGIRTKQRTAYLSMEQWDAAAGMVVEEQLKGRRCHGGLDLSTVEDIAALCWDFPGEDDDHELLWRFWLPEAKRKAIHKRTGGASEVWIREGWLTLTEGDVIDNDAIFAQIDADAQAFEVETLGYDRWGASDLIRRVTDNGMLCVPIAQGYASLSAPLKEMKRLTLSKRYQHGGNPVMRWMVDNLAVRMDPSGNVKPDKEQSGDKIDGVAAAVNALKECMDQAEEQTVELEGSLVVTRDE